MDEKKIISIVVPCYNVASYIQQCVDSIISQTYSNWELILVDDGSTDKTPQICDYYSQKDSRIHVIHKANGGLVSARNVGYEAVTGDWLVYVDGDDWVSPNLVESITHVIHSHDDLDLIFFCAVQELHNKTVEGKWNWDQYVDGKIYVKDENISLSSYVLNYNSGISDVWGKAFRVKWCHSYDIKHNPKLRQGEESVDLIMRAFYYANRALFFKKQLYHYRYNENSISKRVDENNTFCIIDCMHIIKSFIDSIPYNNKFMQEFELRNAYLLLSIAMQTYFHPNNPNGYKERRQKFIVLIENTPLFLDAVHNINCNQFDKIRKIAFWSIKKRHFFLLDIIGKLKQFVLKLGVFKY